MSNEILKRGQIYEREGAGYFGDPVRRIVITADDESVTYRLDNYQTRRRTTRALWDRWAKKAHYAGEVEE